MTEKVENNHMVDLKYYVKYAKDVKSLRYTP